MATEGSFQTIFVGDLSYFATEADLFALFSQFGPVGSVKLQRGVNGENLQYAFIEIHRHGAEKAVQTLQGQRFSGRKLRLSSSLPEEPREKRRARHEFIQVHVSFLTTKTDVVINEEYLERNFQMYGEIEDVTVKQHSLTRSPPKQSGYGFVYFMDVDSALRAIESLKGVELEGILYDCSLSHQSEQDLRRRSMLPPNIAAYRSPASNRNNGENNNNGQHRNNGGDYNNNSRNNHRNRNNNHHQYNENNNNNYRGARGRNGGDNGNKQGQQQQMQQEMWQPQNGYAGQEYMSSNMPMFPNPAMAAAYMYNWQQQQYQMMLQMPEYQQQFMEYQQQMYAYQMKQQQQAQQQQMNAAAAVQQQMQQQQQSTQGAAPIPSPSMNLPMPMLIPPPYPISMLTADMAGMNLANGGYAAVNNMNYSGYPTPITMPTSVTEQVEYMHSASTDSCHSYAARGASGNQGGLSPFMQSSKHGMTDGTNATATATTYGTNGVNDTSHKNSSSNGSTPATTGEAAMNSNGPQQTLTRGEVSKPSYAKKVLKGIGEKGSNQSSDSLSSGDSCDCPQTSGSVVGAKAVTSA
jgi:hypothetical protein